MTTLEQAVQDARLTEELLDRAEQTGDDLVERGALLLRALIREVREWVCPECHVVYPGPPPRGLDALSCTECEGLMMPKPLFDRIEFEERISRLDIDKHIKRACETCHFWHKHSDKAGECRRRAPIEHEVKHPNMPERDYYYTAHPGTAPDHWCGEHEST